MSLLLGCGSDSNGAEAKLVANAGAVDEKHPAASSSTLFAREITKQHCDLLTPDMVAELAGVDSSTLKQRNVAGMCIYSWDGGQASLGHLRTRDSVEFARSSFENSYRNQTGEDVAQSMAKIDAGIEKSKAEGKTDVDPEQAKMVTGAMSNLFSGGLQFEDIAGLGDAASFEITRTESQIGGTTFVSYANSLNVLVSNLKFTVSFNRDGEPKLYRDENVALAEAVLQKLSD
jgi:hypothetical protein